MTYDETKTILNKSPGLHLREITKYLNQNNLEMAILYVQTQTGCDKEIATKIINEIIQTINRTNAQIVHIQSTPTITCPYCQSTDTKKISGTSRWVSTGLFGLASNKIGKNFHCNKCKADF